MSDCPGCFRDARSYRDKLNQERINAKSKADKEKVPYAIIVSQEVEGFTSFPLGDVIPPGTVDIITPSL